jgi:prostaglandin-endoperoxide synthase 2
MFLWFRRLVWFLVVAFRWMFRWRALRVFSSREYIDLLSSQTEARPRPFSLATAAPAGATGGQSFDFVTWISLTDRGFTGRHLGSPTLALQLPSNDAPSGGPAMHGPVTELFRRGAARACASEGKAPNPVQVPQGFQASSRSSVLFTFFAQWFIDSLFRTYATDPRRNTSNHDIDLCQIYGLTPQTTDALREKTGGRLIARRVKGAEYPDLLYEEVLGSPNLLQIKNRYLTLPYADDVDGKVFKKFEHADARRKYLYAAGLDVGNASIGYTAITTIFLREHNRLCAELQSRHLRDPSWDDERLFQTVRNINIVLLLKILVEDYINHILGIRLFLLEPGFAERRDWYRPNWMALEFNLLYRWHSLVPDQLRVRKRSLSPADFRFNNELLEDVGVAAVLDAASKEPAGRIGLHNTPEFLLTAERASIDLGRCFRLDSFNAYRKKFTLPPLTSFDHLLPNRPGEAKQLADLYKAGIDHLEFVVGVFAEEAPKGALFGDLMTRLVAYDALTQIYSNPLLSVNVFNAETFTEFGLETIRDTNSLQELVNRNVPEESREPAEDRIVQPLASLGRGITVRDLLRAPRAG